MSRRVLITGAASGIGRATAVQLAARGDRLALWDMAADALAQVAAEVGDAPHAVVDVTDRAAVAAAAGSAADALGGIDAVVHCAGILSTGTFLDIDLARHEQIVRVNLGGTVVVAHTLLPYLLESRGTLLLMGSASAFYGPPEFASYGATKAGVLNFAQALRIELHGTGVSVVTCNPLFVDSPMLAGQQSEARFVRSEGMAHTSEDVARAIVAGLDRRRFFAWPSWGPRKIWLLSRLLFPFANALMGRAWRKAARVGAGK